MCTQSSGSLTAQGLHLHGPRRTSRVLPIASNIQSQLAGKLGAGIAVLDAAKKNSAGTAANQLQVFVNAVAADVQGGNLTDGPVINIWLVPLTMMMKSVNAGETQRRQYTVP